MNLGQKFEAIRNKKMPKRGKEKIAEYKKELEELLLEALWSEKNYAEVVIMWLTDALLELESDSRDLTVCRAKWQKLREDQDDF